MERLTATLRKLHPEMAGENAQAPEEGRAIGPKEEGWELAHRSLTALFTLSPRPAGLPSAPSSPRPVERFEPFGTPLHRAVRQGNEPTVHLLLAHRADPNRRDRRGRTPLHWAVYHRREMLVEMLLAYGAEAQLQDHRGLTPLQLADDDWVDTLHELFTLHRETLNALASLPLPSLSMEAPVQ